MTPTTWNIVSGPGRLALGRHVASGNQFDDGTLTFVLDAAGHDPRTVEAFVTSVGRTTSPSRLALAGFEQGNADVMFSAEYAPDEKAAHGALTFAE